MQGALVRKVTQRSRRCRCCDLDPATRSVESGCVIPAAQLLSPQLLPSLPRVSATEVTRTDSCLSCRCHPEKTRDDVSALVPSRVSLAASLWHQGCLSLHLLSGATRHHESQADC